MISCKECVNKTSGNPAGTHSDYSKNNPNCHSCIWANAVTGKLNNVIKVNYLSIDRPEHKVKRKTAIDTAIEALTEGLDVENLA
jgi:hypothetical protein